MQRKLENNGAFECGTQEAAQASAQIEIESRIRDYVACNLLFNESGFPHQDDESFLRKGVIDSLGVIELVTFVEREFHVPVKPAEITPENFDSVKQLAAFIRRKTRSPKEVSYAGS